MDVSVRMDHSIAPAITHTEACIAGRFENPTLVMGAPRTMIVCDPPYEPTKND